MQINNKYSAELWIINDKKNDHKSADDINIFFINKKTKETIMCIFYS